MKRHGGSPVVTDVVLAGAGHAHVQVLKSFGMQPMPGVRLTMITHEVHTPYSGMLPGLVSGFYDFDQTHLDTGPLCRFAGARLYQGSVAGLDLKRRLVLCNNRPPVPYDILSINTGSTPNTAAVPGASEHAVPVKRIDRFLARFQDILRRTLDAGGRRRLVMAGAGAGGVELILAVEYRLRQEVQAAGHNAAGLSFVLLSAPPEILPGFPKSFRERFKAVLQRRGIHVMTGAAVTRVEPGRVHINGSTVLPADDVLWMTDARAAGWLPSTGLALDERGFIKVDETLRAVGHSNIFAAGDAISFGPRPLPKSGVYSVRSGPVLTQNIRRLAAGRPLKAFNPQRSAMYLVTAGGKQAIGTRNGLVFGGDWVWRWKDRIDRRFIATFNELPEIGAGAGVLPQTLSRPELVAGIDAAAGAAVMDTGGDTLTIQTADCFPALIDDPYMSGKIAANHALGDIYAMGGTPRTALAIVTLPHAAGAKAGADLTALLTGASEVLRQADCALAGGRTGEGAEMALGFAMTGTVPRERLLGKGSAQPGDALILTKPLGTGTLFAADRRGKAKARWVMAAIGQMVQPGRAAAQILIRHGARAAASVTGSGLIGHLVEMLEAGRAGARLDLDRLPVLDGARETMAAGILSPLHPRNVQWRGAVALADEWEEHPLYPLLFDPQTAGGLLAAVPASEAAACLGALTAAGYAGAAIIGEVTVRDGNSSAVTLGETLHFAGA